MARTRWAELLLSIVVVLTGVLHSFRVPLMLCIYLGGLVLILPYLALVSCKASWHFPQDFLSALRPRYYIENDFLRQRHVWASLRRLAGNMVLLGTLLFLVALGRLLPDLAPYFTFSDLEAQLVNSFPAGLELHLRNGTLEFRSESSESGDLQLQLPTVLFDISGGVFSDVFEDGGSLGVKDLFLFLPLFRATIPMLDNWDPYVRVTEFSVGDRVEVHVNRQLIRCGAPRRILPVPLKRLWLPAVVQAVEPSRKLADFRYSVLVDASGRYNEQQPGEAAAPANVTLDSPGAAASETGWRLTCVVPASSLRRAAHAVLVHPSRTLDAADLKVSQALLVFESTRFAILEGYSHIYKQHWQYINLRNHSANTSSSAGSSSSSTNSDADDNSTESCGDDDDSSTCSSAGAPEDSSNEDEAETAPPEQSAGASNSSRDEANAVSESSADASYSEGETDTEPESSAVGRSAGASNSSGDEADAAPESSADASDSSEHEADAEPENSAVVGRSTGASNSSGDEADAAPKSSAAASDSSEGEADAEPESSADASDSSRGNADAAPESSADASNSSSEYEADAEPDSSADASNSSEDEADEADAEPSDSSGEGDDEDDTAPLEPSRAHLWHSYDLSELHSYVPLSYALSVFCTSVDNASDDLYCARSVGEEYFAEMQAEWPGLTILVRHNLHLPVLLASLWVLCVIATVFCRIGALCAIYTPVAFVACGLMRHVETPLVPISTVFGVVLHSGLLLIIMRRISYVVWDGWGEEGHLHPILQACFQFDKGHQFIMVISWAIWTGYLVIRMREHNNQQAWQERIDAQRAGMASAKSRTKATSSVDRVGASEPVSACANDAPNLADDAAECGSGADASQRRAADVTECERDGEAEEVQALPLLDAEDSLPTCRICYDGASSGRLISPCLCSGSMMFVHIDCLTKWRLGSANPQSFYQCDQCHYRYSFKRTTYAKVLRSAFVLHIVTALAFLSTVVICSHCLQMLEGVLHPGSLGEPPLSSDGLLRQIANETETEEEALREQMEQLENFSLGGIKFSHLIRGLMVVGIGGSFWMGFCWFPPGSASSITVLIIFIGAIRVMVGLYRFFKTSSRWLLQSMENMVLEVGPGADAVAAALAARRSEATSSTGSEFAVPGEPNETAEALSTASNAGASSHLDDAGGMGHEADPDDAVQDVGGAVATEDHQR